MMSRSESETSSEVDFNSIDTDSDDEMEVCDDTIPSFTERMKKRISVCGILPIFAGWIIIFIMSGLTSCYGFTFTEYVKIFNKSRFMISLIPAFYMGTNLMSVPLAVYFVKKCGYKKTVMLGSCMGILGYGLCALSNNLWIVIFTAGIIAGIAVSFCTTTAITYISKYFPVKRVILPMSILFSGSGFGTVTFLSLTEKFFITGKWRILNMVYAISFLITIFTRFLLKNKSDDKILSLPMSELKRSINPFYVSNSTLDEEKYVRFCKSLSDLSDFYVDKEFDNYDTMKSSSASGYLNKFYSYPNIDTINELYANISFASRTPSIVASVVKKTIKNFIHLDDPKFKKITIANCFFYVACTIPFIYIKDMAIAAKAEKFGIWYIATMGLFSTIGEIIVEIIVNKFPKCSKFVYTFCMFICGMAVISMPYIDLQNFWTFFALCAIFGGCQKGNDAITIYIIHKRYSAYNFYKPYGTSCLLRGPLTFSGLIMTGILYDITGSYTIPFTLGGLLIIISGFVYCMSSQTIFVFKWPLLNN